MRKLVDFDIVMKLAKKAREAWLKPLQHDLEKNALWSKLRERPDASPKTDKDKTSQKD